MYLLVVGISGLYLLVVSRRLDCSQAMDNVECVRGSSNALSVHLGNAGVLPLVRLEATFSISDADGGDAETISSSMVLAGRESRDFALDVDFDHVGVYLAGLESVEVFDLLGLFSRTVRVGRRCSVRVVPRVQRIDRLGGSELVATDATRSVRTTISDDMDYAAVRDYRPGDPMKTVHWKMAARGDGHLYTKLFESQTNPGTTVLLDFYCTEPDPLRRADMYDTLLEAGWSIVAYARRVGIQTQLVYREREGSVRSTHANDSESMGALVGELPRLSDAPSPGAAADMLLTEAHDPDACANLVLLTCELTKESVDALVSHDRLRRSARVVCVVPPGLTPEQRAERLRTAGRLAAAQVPFSAIACGADVARAVRR